MLCGEPLASLDAATRCRLRAHAVGYVFQTANLLPSFTAFENVAFARHVSGGSGEPDPAELLALVGLAAKLDALPEELSGGEGQRVAIARALAQQPKLLLCDEPTGQLDSDTGERVLDLIAALQERLDFALVVATHAPDVGARSDRVITLDDGRVVSDRELGLG
jgi:putative ABC transport system ATP-binding protein